VSNTPSWKTKKAQCAHLKRLLGTLPLQDVTKVRVMEYKNRRLSETLVRHGEQVEGTSIMGSTVNREVSCLIAALNLAAGEGLCEGAPRVTKERETPRERILTDAEYNALIDASPRWLQRVLIGANEAAFDRGTLLRLTWDGVQDGLIVVKGGRAKTGARQRVGISPALREVLDELRAEYKRIPNTERRVFTKGGKPIPKATLRHAFDKAVADAEIEDFQFRDFRHCARTRRAAAGLPFEVAETGLGHKVRGMAGRYTNLSDDHIRDAFENLATRWRHEKTASNENRERSA
jgi:integrase